MRGNPTTYNGVSLTWDAQDNATAFGNLLTAGYTSDGLRAWKQDAQNNRTYFLYDGTTPVLELYADGSAKAANTWGANGLVSRREYASGGTGQASGFYGFDERGNASERTDATGTVLTRTVTDAYGNTSVLDAAGTALPNLPDPYSGYGAQFGYYADAETGLYLCTFRYYDPQNARWLNRDPIGYEGGLNVYAYVTGNPVNGYDPLGQYATVKTNGSKVKIFIPIEFNFDRRFRNINDINWWKRQIINDIQTRWTGTFGKYSVTTQVVDVSYIKNYKKPYNSIDIAKGDGRSNCRMGNPFIDEYPYGTWYTTKEKLELHTYAHEAGHLMRLDDRYSDVWTPHWGFDVKSVPHAGWEGNIMSNKWNPVEERNITEILNLH